LLKASQGKDTGGRPLYGYRREPDADRGVRLVPDGRRADAVRLIFDMYDRGYSLWDIAHDLYARGVPSPRGGARWTRSVIQRLLTNRRFVGDWTWGVHASGKCHRYGKDGVRTRSRTEKTSAVNGAECWVVRPDSHEPLVSREVFARVQGQLRDNRPRTTPLHGGGGFCLGRLLVCGHCGGFLVGVNVRNRRVYLCGDYLAHGRDYCKRNMVHEAQILDIIIRELQKAFLNPDNLQRLRAEVAEMVATERADGNLNRLHARVNTLRLQIDRGNENLAILPPDRIPGVIAKVRQWEGELAGLSAEIRRIEAGSRVEELERHIQAAEDCLWRLQEAAQGQDRHLLRQVLRETIAKVVIWFEHRPTARLTRSRPARGEIYPRTTEEPSNLSPSADR
jgi:hypothetical protein